MTQPPNLGEGARSGQANEEYWGWRQADVFGLEGIAIVGDDGAPQVVATPNGVGVVSQSCDVVLTHRPYVQVAPVISLEGTESLAARDGKRSRFVHLPELGDDWFIDLDQVSTLSKRALIGRWRSHGAASDHQVRRFAGAVARRFGRFAFPDDVSDAMKPLRDLIQSRAGNDASPFGALLDDVLELRAESPNWAHQPPSVTLVFVVKPGVLPTFADDHLPDEPPGLAAEFKPDDATAKAMLTKIATALTDAETPPSSEAEHWLWLWLAQAAAMLCSQASRKALDKNVMAPGALTVSGNDTPPQFDSDVVSADEFPLSRVRVSEIIDLDHLSPPVPMA